ncbi:MAG: hypothetical protein NTW59_03800, partial [Candidatus Diapherotrites archaeon]|nr:hypothetical protein [Candidatus Diapherotrites archaeon]
FSIETNKKAKDVKTFIENNKTTLASNNEDKLLAVLCPDEFYLDAGKPEDKAKIDACLNKYYSSKELFRWVFKQVDLGDEFNKKEGDTYKQKKLLLFVGTDGRVLSNEKIQFKDAILSKAKAVKDFGTPTQSNASGITEKLGELLELLNSTFGEKESIVAEIKQWEFTEDDADVLQAFHVDNVSDIVSGYSLMSFNEYRIFHKALSDALNQYQTKCFKADGKTRPDKKEEAVICEVDVPKTDVLGSVPTVVVKAGFLKNLLASTTFKIGVLDSADISDAMKQFAMEKAQAVESLTLPEGYEKFMDLYNKAIDSNAFLIQDGYSKALRSDLDAYYQKAIGSEAQAAQEALGAVKFKDGNWNFNNADSFALEEAGKYRIVLDLQYPAFDVEKPGKHNLQFTKAKTLAELDSAAAEAKQKDTKVVETKLADNIFFSLPFDGEVWGGSATEKKREGYGLSYKFSGALPEGAIAGVSYKSDQEKTEFANSTGGTKTYNFTFGGNFAATKTGTVFVASSGDMVYIPSSPVKLSLQLQPRVNGAEGMLYELVDMKAANQYAMQPHNTDNIMMWFESNGKGFKDTKMTPMAAKGICPEETQERYGFSKDITAASTFKGITFVPFYKPFGLMVLCTQGAATLDSGAGNNKNITVPAGALKIGETGRTVTLNSIADAKKTALAGYVAKIKTGEICVDASPEAVEMLWNKGKMLEGFLTAEGSTASAKTMEELVPPMAPRQAIEAVRNANR